MQNRFPVGTKLVCLRKLPFSWSKLNPGDRCTIVKSGYYFRTNEASKDLDWNRIREISPEGYDGPPNFKLYKPIIIIGDNTDA